MKSSLVTRNIRIDQRRTSVRLEPQLWRALETIAEFEQRDINDICTTVAAERGPDGGFTSALRVYIVEYFGGEALRRREAADEGAGEEAAADRAAFMADHAADHAAGHGGSSASDRVIAAALDAADRNAQESERESEREGERAAKERTTPEPVMREASETDRAAASPAVMAQSSLSDAVRESRKLNAREFELNRGEDTPARARRGARKMAM